MGLERMYIQELCHISYRRAKIVIIMKSEETECHAGNSEYERQRREQMEISVSSICSYSVPHSCTFGRIVTLLTWILSNARLHNNRAARAFCCCCRWLFVRGVHLFDVVAFILYWHCSSSASRHWGLYLMSSFLLSTSDLCIREYTRIAGTFTGYAFRYQYIYVYVLRPEILIRKIYGSVYGWITQMQTLVHTAIFGFHLGWYIFACTSHLIVSYINLCVSVDSFQCSDLVMFLTSNTCPIFD